MNPMILLIVFLAVAAAAGVLFFVFMDRGSPRTTERLETLVGKRRKESAAELLIKDSARESDKNKLLEAITPKFLSVSKMFEQADCHIKPSSLMGVGLLMGLMTATLSFFVVRNIFVALIVALAGFSLPFLWLWNKRRKRLKSFASQLSDGLELVARALRAGHALGAGMHVVAEEMPSPISDEFGRVYEEQNLGISLEDAMRNMCSRVPNLDLRFFVTAVAIQRQTGGDLAEILDKIGYVIRERYKIMGQVKALTAEGRMSGIMLIGLPFILLIVMMHINYNYVQLLWTTDEGIKMSGFGMIMMVLGALLIKKIVDIKV